MPTGAKSYLSSSPYISLSTLVLFTDPSCGARTCNPLVYSFILCAGRYRIHHRPVRSSDPRFQVLRDSFLPEKSCNYSVLKITHNRSWYIYLSRYPLLDGLVKLHGVTDRVIPPSASTSISAILRMKASSKSVRSLPHLTMSRLRLKDVATASWTRFTSISRVSRRDTATKSICY